MNTVATDELDELSAALEDPAHAGLAEAVERVSKAVRRHLEGGSPSSAEFMTRMARLLKRVPGIERSAPAIDAFFDAALYFYLLGRPFDGLAYALDAVKLSRRSGHVLLRKCLTLQAIIDADTGNMPRAIEGYVEALDLARARRDADPFGETSVWMNLGVALNYAAQYRDSLACLEHAVHLGSEAGAGSLGQSLAKAATANIALCCLHLGEIERGLKAAEGALRGMGEPRSSADFTSRVLREHYYVRLLVEAGEVQAAGEHAAIAQRYAYATSSVRAQIAADSAQGLYEVRAGRTEAGIERLTRAAERSRRELPVMLRDVLSTLVKAYEFLGMPREALVHVQEIHEWLRRYHHHNALEHVRLHLEPLDAESERDSIYASQLRNQEAQLRGKVAEQEMFRSPSEMLERLAVTAELRDDSTGEHCYRLGRLAALLAHAAGSDPETCERIERAARLHDIGKNAIPDAIILKRGKLTDTERQIMRTHSAAGADLLAGSNIPGMRTAEEIARHHHDWWDGSNGEICSGEDIPYAARLVALADVFDALIHVRPHRGPWTIREALDEIARLKGKQFDPRLTDLFVELIQNLRREHKDLDAFLGEAAKTSSFLRARSRIKEALQGGQ
jgi:putative two-component system response regulator